MKEHNKGKRRRYQKNLLKTLRNPEKREELIKELINRDGTPLRSILPPASPQLARRCR